MIYGDLYKEVWDMVRAGVDEQEIYKSMINKGYSPHIVIFAMNEIESDIAWGNR